MKNQAQFYTACMRRLYAYHQLPLTMTLVSGYSRSTMDLVEEVKSVEKELAQLIIDHLKANKIAVDVARQQARDFLAALPVKDQKDFLEKLKQLGQKYEEAKIVYAEELGKVNEIERLQALDSMRIFIQQGDMESAIGVAKTLYAKESQDASGQAKGGLL